MAFDLSMSFWTDLVLGEIADRFGVELALRLVPYQENTAPDVLDQSRNRTFSIGAVDGVGRDSRIGAIIHKLSSFYAEARQVIGWDALGSGSNSWAVRLQQATPPDAILANDPHLQLALPPRWYPVHLTSPSFNVIGMTVPGLPVVLAGRNDAIAWGVTNVMLDDCDYFLEQQDTAAPIESLLAQKVFGSRFGRILFVFVVWHQQLSGCAALVIALFCLTFISLRKQILSLAFRHSGVGRHLPAAT